MSKIVKFPKAKRPRPKKPGKPSKAAARAYRAHFSQVCGHLDSAVAMAVLLHIDRKVFVECAGQCFDYWTHMDEVGPPDAVA